MNSLRTHTLRFSLRVALLSLSAGLVACGPHRAQSIAEGLLAQDTVCVSLDWVGSRPTFMTRALSDTVRLLPRTYMDQQRDERGGPAEAQPRLPGYADLNSWSLRGVKLRIEARTPDMQDFIIQASGRGSEHGQWTREPPSYGKGEVRVQRVPC